jgi:hypothetical protein
MGHPRGTLAPVLCLSFVAVAFSKVTVLSSNDILGQVISEVCYAKTTSAVGG